MEDLALYPRRSLNEVRYKRKIANHLWIFFALSCIGSFFTFVFLRIQMFQRFANRKSHDDPPRKAPAASLRPYSVAGSRTISLTSRCMACRIHLGPIWRPSLRCARKASYTFCSSAANVPCLCLNLQVLRVALHRNLLRMSTLWRTHVRTWLLEMLYRSPTIDATTGLNSGAICL